MQIAEFIEMETAERASLLRRLPKKEREALAVLLSRYQEAKRLEFTWHPRQAECNRLIEQKREEIARRHKTIGGIPVVLFGGAVGGGKALALDTPIPTPDGWTTMGELQPGSRVFDENGRECNVTAATEVMYDHDCYEVVFSDGTVITADAGHLWATLTQRERDNARRHSDSFREKRRASRPRRGTGKKPWVAERNTETASSTPFVTPPPRTTEQIDVTLSARHSVAVAGPLDYIEGYLPLDPYILGAWLGDGTTTAGAITTADDEIVQAFEDAGFEMLKWKARYAWGVRGLRPKLVEIGVLGDKHIPPAYLRGSIASREALLQGLMDTDGTIRPSGQCEFQVTNERLATDTLALVRSLGYKARMTTRRAMLRGKDCGTAYRIKWTPDRPVFRLSRKLARQNKSVRPVNQVRYIEDVRRVESVPVKCISVDSESRLFLASESCIPTHNSFYVCAKTTLTCEKVPGFRVYMCRNEAKAFTRTTLDTMLRQVGILSRPGWKHLKHDMVFRHDNGSRIEYGGLGSTEDAERVKSMELDAAVIEEGSDTEEAPARLLITRPGRSERSLRFGYVIITSNPEDCWLQRIVDDPKQDEVFVQSLMRDNTFLPQGYEERIRDLYSDTPELMDAYIDGVWGMVGSADKLVDPMVLRRCVGAAGVDGPHRWGVDVARFGDDTTVLYRARGSRIVGIAQWERKSVKQVADDIEAMYQASEDSPEEIRIDDIGVGGGVVDILESAGLPAVGINVGSTAMQSDKFINRRAEVYWNLKLLAERGELSLPADDELLSELRAVRYLVRNGKIVLEAKAEVKKRLGRSPDKSDALALCLAPVKAPRRIAGSIGKPRGW